MSGLTATQSLEKPATLEHACRIIDKLQHLARINGYMLALYGSTLTHGRGHDIDVVAVPWRHGAEPVDLVIQIEASGFTKVGEPYRGMMRTYAQQFVENKTRLVLDLQVRETYLTT